MDDPGGFKDKFINQIDPIVITDLSGLILDANSKFLQETGVTPDEVRSKHISRYAEGTDTVLHHEFQINKAINLSGSNLVTVDGSVVPADLHVCWMNSGQAQYLQWTYRIQPGSLQLDDYSAMIVHDLRTPLSNIITSLELLETLPPVSGCSDAKEVIQIARRSAAQLSDDLSNLLDSHRLLSGRSLIRTEWTDLTAIIQGAIEMLKPAADGRLQTIQFNPGNLPGIMADADMLRRVIANLLENAVKYSPAGCDISVTAESSGQDLMIAVTNSMMAAGEQLDGHAEGQSTADNGTSASRQYGLGLAFCDLAVKAHGGELKERINHDGSRTSTVYLPLIKNIHLTGTINKEV